MKALRIAAIFLCLIACSKKEDKTVTPPPVTNTPPVAVNNTPPPATPAQNLGPLEAIKELDRKVDSYKSGANLSPEEVEANRKLKQEVIRGTFDIAELCKRALDVNWEPLNEQQRSDFIQLMTSLLEKKAILSKEQVKGTDKPYKIVYRSEQYLNPEKTNAQVATKLFVPSEKIDLDINYKLALTEKGWHIFDVIVDNASLVENYKFQFDTIIKKSGYPELISRMEKKLKDME